MDITRRKKKEYTTSKKMFLRRKQSLLEVAESSNNHKSNNINKCTTRTPKTTTIRNMSCQRTVSTAYCRLLSVSLNVLFLCSIALQLSAPVALARLMERSTSGAGAGESFNLHQHYQEIEVQPGSDLKIECKLPSSDPSDLHSWMFQQELPDTPPKPHTLSFNADEFDNIFSYDIEMDLTARTYDLTLNNVTTINNGLYVCKSRSQTRSREYRLTVLVPPQAPQISAGSSNGAPAREGVEYQLSCLSQGGNPEPNITWYRNDQPVIPGGPIKIEQARNNGTTNSTLTWAPTMEDHQATYKCSVWNKAMNQMVLVQALEREIRVQVEYSPRIIVGQYNPLKVLIGSPITLSCQVDANPPVKGIRWYKDGQTLISSQFNHTINEAKIFDSSVYSCQADNGIAPYFVGNSLNLHGQVVGPFSLYGMASSSGSNGLEQHKSSSAVEAQLVVQVLYPPRVQVRPSRVAPLNEGDSFSLNCSVDSSPPAHEFVWTKLDDPSFRRVSNSASQGASSTLEFPSVSANDMGNYTCTAFNRLEPSVASYLQQQTVSERHGSGSAQVQVRHKPGLAEIFVGQNGEAELGQRAQLVCRAKPPGFPEPQYKFYKHTGSKNSLNRQTQMSSYTFMSVKADDEARYSCVVSNEMGSSNEPEGELVVNELPTIISDASTRLADDNRTVGEHSYAISVRANGKPEPKVTWYHRSPVDGRRHELSAPEWQSRFRIDTTKTLEQVGSQMGGRVKYTVTTTLVFKTPLEVDDRGLYSVEFNNGLSKVAVKELQLHISHPPIPALPNQPIIAGQTRQAQMKAGFNPGEPVNLTCRVSAHPKPIFVWYANSARETDKSIENNSRYRITMENPRDDIWESTLSFLYANRDDYGDYLCSAANTDPQTNTLSDTTKIVIHLSEKTVPDAPFQVEAIEAGQDSVTLQWIPGFDGGFAQVQYLVQYAPDDGSGAQAQLSRRFPNFDAKFSAPTASASSSSSNYLDNIDLSQAQQALQLGSNGKDYPKLFDCLSINPCTIGQLLPRQSYVFRVFAKNAAGPSEFSDELRATTRANLSHIPKILNASFDPVNNILHFRIEPGSDYLLNSLNARIEMRPYPGTQAALNSIESGSTGGQADEMSLQQQQPASSSGWRLNTTVPITQENAKAYLAMQPDYELRLTLCSRLNESLCGPEYEVSSNSAASSFLEGQRGLSLYILMSTLSMIILLAGLATAVHSCCLSKRKAKKADTIERVDGSIDNKPIANGTANGSLPGAVHKSSHGSTTSTNSTSANGGASSTNGLQSMDSITGVLNAGTTSDHSSDHSRQAKLDSMLPPNYNHYADRNSILMEQQQQQQQQQQMMMQQQHQVGLMTSDKLGAPFGLANSALLSVAGQQQQHPSPLMDDTNGLNYFTYQSQVEAQQQQQSLADGGMMLNAAALEASDAMSQQQQAAHSMWPNQMDEYNPYNALGYANQAAQEQMLDPAYGTTGAVMMSQHSAAYDNSASSGQFQSYLNAYQSSQVADTPTSAAQYQQQRAQYQAELAVAQQQMYGTLTRNGYGAAGNNNSSDINNKSLQNTSSNQQLIDQQQQYSTTTTTNGLNPASQSTPLGQQQPQESDYGTTGGRAGRLIREIIV